MITIFERQSLANVFVRTRRAKVCDLQRGRPTMIEKDDDIVRLQIPMHLAELMHARYSPAYV